MARRRRAPAEPLAGDLEADVAIVGGGFTGLWTAHFLKEIEPSLSVCVVERRVAGFGGSGRNAGIVGEALDHSHELAIAHFGLDEARELARVGRENLDGLERFVAERRIDADFRRPGQLTVALTDAHRASLETSARAAERVGARGREASVARGDPRRDREPALRGLAPRPRATAWWIRPASSPGCAARRSGRASASSRARRSSRSRSAGDRVLVRAASGSVRARRAVLATNAYSHQLFPSLQRRFLPLYDYILVSRPLSPSEREAHRLEARAGSGRRADLLQLLPADGGRPDPLGHERGGVLPGQPRGRLVRPLARRITRRSGRASGGTFRSWRTSSSRSPWGGPIASTTRLTPFFGTLDGRIAYGLGYTGHGIGSTRVAGKILAHLALEKAQSAPRALDGPAQAHSVSAGAAAAPRRGGRDAGPAPRGRRGSGRSDPEDPRGPRDRLLVVAGRYFTGTTTISTECRGPHSR